MALLGHINMFLPDVDFSFVCTKIPVHFTSSRPSVLSCCAASAAVLQLIRSRLSLMCGCKLQSVQHVVAIIRIRNGDSVLAA